MSLSLASSSALFATVVAALLVIKERAPPQQAILVASVAAMAFVTIDQIVGTPAEVFIPVGSALVLGIFGMLFYDYGHRRQGRASE